MESLVEFASLRVLSVFGTVVCLYILIIDFFFLCIYRAQRLPEIVIAVVACGMRLQETLNMLKSAIIFNVERMPLRFVIVTEQNLITSFKEKVCFCQIFQFYF